ncbi:MAG TPA: hypothetical protein VLV78_22905 [Thermoanaerobaculia bacterium]|nr:hypothetical protein [Thermoanaerobaculia bacterium]
MISCETFRAQFAPGTPDVALLEHLRSCDACLNYAVENDGDVLFRAIGGGELVPPGGVDAFVDDVMRAVQIRSAESTVSSRGVMWPRKLALAATVAVAITGAAWIREHNTIAVAPPPPPAVQRAAKVVPKPVVENYESQKATIVEMPTDGENVKVVMVFDESLPADL